MSDTRIDAIVRAAEAALEQAQRESHVTIGPFDSPGSCVTALEDSAKEIAGFEWQWGNAAGALNEAERALEAAEAHALVHLENDVKDFENRFDRAPTVDERKALVFVRVDKEYPALRQSVASLRGAVERCKSRFKALDRIANNAQSVLASDREQLRREAFVQS